MPRLQPWPGYVGGGEAARRLGISDAMLSRWVAEKRLNRYGPADRSHKWYKESEIAAILAAREIQPEEPTYYPSFPALAQPGDMPAIVEISRAIFNTDGSEPIPAETRLAWLRKNPETFWVLRRPDGVIVAYACILPMVEEAIVRFIRGEISAEEIGAEDIDVYAGAPHAKHLYIMAIGVDPAHPAQAKHSYGRRLLSAIFDFLLGLGERGIEIAKITARSRMPDGVRLLRKMGIPQIKPWTPGLALFQLHIPTSGLPLFLDYEQRLGAYRAAHQGTLDAPRTALPPSIPRPAHTHGQRGASALPPLPGDLVSWYGFAEKHGMSHSTVNKAVGNGRLPVVTEGGPWLTTAGTHAAPVKEALDAAGRARFYDLWGETNPKFTPCAECPHRLPDAGGAML